MSSEGLLTDADGRAHGLDQQRLRSELCLAIRHGEIQPYYQPQLDLRTGRIVGLEALARWIHPRYGTVEPDRFIPLAEESGRIGDIGEQVLRSACRFGAGIRRVIPDLTISVNTSTSELTSPTYAAKVHDALCASALPPAALTLEITEARPAGDLRSLQEQACRLHEEGVRISLDDFGTRYSAVADLRILPISELKIDRSFVQTAQEPAGALIAGIIALAHRIGVSVVGEGVESPDQLDRLRRMGCDRAQGFLIGRPMAAGDLTRALRRPLDV